MKLFKKSTIFAILFLIALSAIFYPAILNPNTQISGNGGGDDFGGIYGMWIGKHFNNDKAKLSVNSLINYPFGVKAEKSIFPYSNTIISILQKYFDEIFIHNLLSWISFPLAALGMYFLCCCITRSKLISTITGILYMLIPYHFIRATGHTSLAYYGWIPLCVLFLIRLAETKKYRNAVLAGLFFSLNFFTDYYYGLFLSIFVLLFFIVRLFWTKSCFSWKKFKLMAVLGLTVFMLIGSYFAVIFWPREGMTTNFAQNDRTEGAQKDSGNANARRMFAFARPAEDLYVFGAKLRYYFLPNIDNYIFGEFNRKVFWNGVPHPNVGAESFIYLGWLAILLAGYGVWGWKKQKNNQNPRNNNQDTITKGGFDFIMILFIVTAIVCVIFSFPPPLSPSKWIYKILPQFRVYARFFIFVSLAVSVLAGVGLKYLFEWIDGLRLKAGLQNNSSRLIILARTITTKIPAERLKLYIFTIILTAVLVDFAPSLKTISVDQPPNEYKWLKNQPENTVIAEYPYVNSVQGPTSTYLFWQRYHQKPMINGQPEPDTTGKERIRLSIYDVTNPRTPIILKKLGTTHLILHKDQYFGSAISVPPDKTISRKVSMTNINSGLKLVKKFGMTYVYEIKK